MKKRKYFKIILFALAFNVFIVFHGEKQVYAAKDTGIKNAIDDAVTGEMIGLCNQLGLESVENGEWPAERPKSIHWLLNKGIAIKNADWWWRYTKPGEPESHYDVDLTYGSFFSQPWPYDRQYKGADGRWHPTVGDVCAKLGVPQVERFVEQGGSADPAYGGRQYNDVNFCEILSILAQGEKGNWKTVDYEEFNEYIRDENAQNLYYEIEFGWYVYYEWEEWVTQENGDRGVETVCIIHGMHIFCGTNKDGEASAQGMPAYLGDEPWLKTKYYAQVKLKPMGLRNLYILADVIPSEINKDFYYHTNAEILNHQEDYTKTYMREDRTLNPVYYDDKRPKTSPIYKELKEYYGEARGRSAPWYIEKPYNLEKDIRVKEYTERFLQQENQTKAFDIQWDGDVNEAQSAILSLAKSAIGRIGYEYGGKATGLGWNAVFGTAAGDDRGRKNGLDCSGFVNWVYSSSVGVTPGSNCASYDGKPEVSKEELKPGMLGIKYGPATKNRSGDHIGIYAGKDSSGKDLWIHCSGSNGVVMNSYGGFTHFYNPIGL